MQNRAACFAMEFRPTNWKKDLLAAEIDVIRQLGVEIRCGVEVGKDVTIEDLTRAGL